MLDTMTRHWWTIALRGIIGVLFGIVALAWPGVTIATLVMLFGAYAAVDGLVALMVAVRLAGQHGRWTASAVQGAIGLAAGILAFAWPGLTAVLLIYLVATWAVASGIMEIAAAIYLRRHLAGEWLLMLGGVISVLLGIFLFADPGAGIVATAYMIGAYALFFGFLLLALALRLRTHGRTTAAGLNLRPQP